MNKIKIGDYEAELKSENAIVGEYAKPTYIVKSFRFLPNRCIEFVLSPHESMIGASEVALVVGQKSDAAHALLCAFNNDESLEMLLR